MHIKTSQSSILSYLQSFTFFSSFKTILDTMKGKQNCWLTGRNKQCLAQKCSNNYTPNKTVKLDDKNPSIKIPHIPNFLSRSQQENLTLKPSEIKSSSKNSEAHYPSRNSRVQLQDCHQGPRTCPNQIFHQNYF